MNLSHRIVRFRVVDIYFPDPSKVLLDLHHDEEIEGEVIDLSDSGSDKEVYAVIKVEGLEQLLTVPTERLELAETLHVPPEDEA